MPARRLNSQFLIRQSWRAAEASRLQSKRQAFSHKLDPFSWGSLLRFARALQFRLSENLETFQDVLLDIGRVVVGCETLDAPAISGDKKFCKIPFDQLGSKDPFGFGFQVGE